MAVLGVLLILIAALVVGAALWAGSQPTVVSPKVDFLGGSYSLHPITMMAIGAGAVLVVFLGLWLMTSAGKRRWRNHRERRDLEKQQREQEKELERTRAELAKRGETPAQADRHVAREETVVREDVRPAHDVRRDDVREVRHDDTRLVRDDQGGMHSGDALSREEEVRRAAERRRDV